MKKFISFFIGMFALIALVACKNDSWKITKEDTSNFICATAKLTQKDDKLVMSFNKNAVAQKKLKTSDVAVFDINAAIETLTSSKADYLTYDIVKKNKAKVTEIVGNDDGTTTIEFKGDINKTYAALINKSVTDGSNYALISANKESLMSANAEQLKFEKDYISKVISWETGGQFAMNLAIQIGMIVAGQVFPTPTVTAGGILNGIGLITGQIFSNAPSIQDVLNKLDDMDRKLDMISAKLDQNHNELMSETVRTQAMIDEVLLNQMEGQISAYATGYANPVSNFKANYADYVEQSYKSFIKNEQTVNVVVRQDENGEWNYVFGFDVEQSDTVITATISSFPNATKHLEDNKNLVRRGFIDEFEKDIADAVKSTTLPENVETEDFAKMVSAKIVEGFTQKYFTENHQEALNLRNLATDYSKIVAGIGQKSILQTYISRLEYMYNFVYEYKDEAIGSIASILLELDSLVALTTQACMFAGVNVDDLSDAYKAARDVAKAKLDYIESQRNTYSFIAECALNGGLYNTNYNVGYKNPGNSPTFNAEFELKVVEYGSMNKYDISYISMISSTTLSRISGRMNVLKKMGLVDYSKSFIEYLHDNYVLYDTSLDEYNKRVASGEIKGDGKILTDYNVRRLESGDKNLALECVAKGNTNGDYFNVGWKGFYQGAHDASNWSGQILEGPLVSAKTGEVLSEKKICAYANYDESHWYWGTDEHHAFKDSKNGNYFYIIRKITW